MVWKNGKENVQRKDTEKTLRKSQGPRTTHREADQLVLLQIWKMKRSNWIANQPWMKPIPHVFLSWFSIEYFLNRNPMKWFERVWRWEIHDESRTAEKVKSKMWNKPESVSEFSLSLFAFAEAKLFVTLVFFQWWNKDWKEGEKKKFTSHKKMAWLSSMK